MNQIDEIKKCCTSIEDNIEHFENTLKKIVNKDKNFLTPDLNKFLFTNPKRLRPRFVFLFARVLNCNSSLVYNIALALELIHSASLIHDDILDFEDTRRNNLTFYKKYGSRLAVLEGDYLLSLANEELAKTNNKILNIFSLRIKKTILGEILQNENLNKILDYDNYIKKTFNKTGNLFMAGLEALFEVCDIDFEIQNNLFEFLKNYSIAFQIKNDIDNFKKNKSDFKNGNYTLPMIYFEKDKKKTDFDECLKKAQNEVLKYKNTALDYLSKIQNQNINPVINLSEITLRS